MSQKTATRDIGSRDDSDCKEKNINAYKWYDKSFREIHFRSVRAEFMNYDESQKYDRWARWTELSACGLCTVGIGASVLGILQWRLTFLFRRFSKILLSTSALMELVAYHPINVSPVSSLAQRAHRHVEAGSEWARIKRLSDMYRSELLNTPPDKVNWDVQRICYKELVNAYHSASNFTVIRRAAYNKFDNVDLMLEIQRKRRTQEETYFEKLERKIEP